jgi:hypothetical protein
MNRYYEVGGLGGFKGKNREGQIKKKVHFQLLKKKLLPLKIGLKGSNPPTR